MSYIVCYRRKVVDKICLCLFLSGLKRSENSQEQVLLASYADSSRDVENALNES